LLREEELRVRRKPLELRVSVDVEYRFHSVAMGLSSSEVLEEFEIDHRIEGFEEFFSRIETHRKKKNCRVTVAMEGYNGHAQPLDSLVRQRGYRLYNLNNLKFARFKEIFPESPRFVPVRRRNQAREKPQANRRETRHVSALLLMRTRMLQMRVKDLSR
jgi:hypothetical protein